MLTIRSSRGPENSKIFRVSGVYDDWFTEWQRLTNNTKSMKNGYMVAIIGIPIILTICEKNGYMPIEFKLDTIRHKKMQVKAMAWKIKNRMVENAKLESKVSSQTGW